MTQSHVTFYSSPSLRSSKVHPHSSKETESWTEDEHFQRRKRESILVLPTPDPTARPRFSQV